MKLPNGYGSVFKLGGNRRRPWAVRVTVGWTEEGKQVYNQGVRGSNPWRGTIQKYAKPRKYGVFAFSGLTQAHAKIRRKHAEFVVVIYT